MFGIAGLALVAGAALYDGVFMPRSVIRILDDGTRVYGMSFAGDPMVWPFCILVPLLVLATIRAYCRLAELVENRVEGRFDFLPAAVLPPILRRTRRILVGYPRFTGFPLSWRDLVQHYRRALYRAGWAQRINHFVFPLCWAFAIGMVGYNMFACGLSDCLPDHYAYTAGRVITSSGELVINNGQGAIRVPKWDCRFGEWPVANVAARIWVLVFYAAIPLMLGFVVRAFIAALVLCHGLTRRLPREATGRAGSAFPITPYSWSLPNVRDELMHVWMLVFYSTSIVLIVALAGAYKELFADVLKETPLFASHNSLAIRTIPFVCLIVLMPLLLAIRKLVVVARDCTLRSFGRDIDRRIAELMDEPEGSGKPGRSRTEGLQALTTLYHRTAGIAAYPMHILQIVKVVLTILVAIVVPLLNELVANTVRALKLF